MSEESESALSVREFPDAKIDFLKYQLGKYHIEKVQIGRYKLASEKVFRLMAWGKDREDAVAMLKKMKEAK